MARKEEGYIPGTRQPIVKPGTLYDDLERRDFTLNALAKDEDGKIIDHFDGIWALENNEADYFLWEKYTTQPFVDKGSCQRIGQVNTPWPCFVIACREELLQNDAEVIHQIIAIVKKQAAALSADKQTAEAIAWRYHLSIPEVTQWLSETTWNTESISLVSAIQPTIDFLLDSELITAKDAESWDTKLF